MSKVDQKVVLLGQHDVGKTCLVERYLHGKWKGERVSATVGSAFGAKMMKLKGTTYTMGVWDTAGSERFESMNRIYYRDAQSAIICYDLTHAGSWKKVKFWLQELQQYVPNCAIYIVGTKLDKIHAGADRGVSGREVNQYGLNIGATTWETSAKENIQIAELFQKVAEDFVNSDAYAHQQHMNHDFDTLSLEQAPTQSNSCC